MRQLTLRAYAAYERIMAPPAWAGLEEAVRAALDDEHSVAEWIVAERAGALVGSVMLFPVAADAYGSATRSATVPELRLLAVAPEARRTGVGEALVQECLRRARRSGAAELGLHTSMSMRGAIQLYERLGFVRAPEFDFQPPGAELVEAYRYRLLRGVEGSG